MNFRIRRRRFAQLTIASATTTLLANLTGKTVAQTNKSGNIIAVKLQQSTINDSNIDKLANSTPLVVLASSNAVTGETSPAITIPATNLQILQKPTESTNKAVYLSPFDRLTGATFLPDGTFVVSAVLSSKKGDITRLTFLDGKSFKLLNGLTLSGFKKKNSTVESLLATRDGKLLAILSLNAGVPPFDFGVIDPKTGIVTSGDQLALPALLPWQRLSNLAQSFDGKLYAIFLDREIPPTLVQLDVEYKSPATGKGRIIRLVQLSLNNKPLGNDLLSLAISPFGQLFALANLDNEKTNSLFSINLKTGELNFQRKFDADKIALNLF